MADKLKYRLQELIDSLPKHMNTVWVTEQLGKNGIPERTFFNDKSIAASDKQDIPGERLLTYSKFFGVPLIDLYNYQISVKPASDRKPSKVIRKVMQSIKAEFKK